MLAWLLASASAADFVTDIGEPQIWEQGGNWSRPIPYNGAWKLGIGTASDYWVADLNPGSEFGEWDLDRDSKVNLTNRGNLKDHSIKRCPDGTYLVASSANVVDPNDSSYWTWVDEDFGPIANGTIEEATNERPHNDLVVLCSAEAQGVIHSEFGQPDYFESTLFHIDRDEGVTGTSTLQDFKSEGGSIIYDTRTNQYVGADASLFFIGGITVFDTDYNVVRREDTVEYVTGDWKESWPQGLHRIGDYFVIAVLARDEVTYGRGDGDGEVWLVVLDDDFNVLERNRLTWFLDEGAGANRPWIARSGNQMLIGFDREVKQGVIEVKLDLDEFGVDGGEDTAIEDPDNPNGDDTGRDGGVPPVCGCTASPTAPAGGALALLAAWVLRRRKPHSM